MAAGRIVLPPYFPARDRNARLVSGAKLYVYTNGTTTKASIYSDLALSVPIANPVAANASGQFPSIWANAGTEAVPVLYTLAITDASGGTIGNPAVFDDYRPSVDSTTASTALAEAASVAAAAAQTAAEAAYADVLAVVATGSDAAAIAARAAKSANLSDLANKETATANLQITKTGTGALTRTVAASLKDAVNATDFAVGDGATNDTAALAALKTAHPDRLVNGAGKTYSISTNLAAGFKMLDGQIVDTRMVTAVDDYGVLGIGHNALAANTYIPEVHAASGGRFFASGNCIVAIGYKAMEANTTGRRMVAVGYRSLLANTTGYYNTACGSHSLESCTTGFQNAALGTQALQAISTGADNVGLGSGSGVAINTGSRNTAAGSESMRVVANGNDNAAFGYQALAGPSGPGVSQCVAVGAYALRLNTGNDSVAVGYRSLWAQTAGAQNTAIGKDSMVTNVTGQDCVAIGYQALQNIDTNNATAVGSQCLAANTAANATALGFQAGNLNTSGTLVTALGYKALRANTTGANSTAVGAQALELATGSNNTGVGRSAGGAITTGGGNTFVGEQAGVTETTGDNNTALGKSANANGSGLSNTTAIGYQAEPTASNQVVIGNSSVTHTVLRGAITATTYTVAGLPSAVTMGVGTRSFVTDAAAPTFGATVTGGGAVATPVFSDGAAWKVG